MLRLLVVVIGCLLASLGLQAQDYEVITPENVHRLERVTSLGHGYIVDSWFSDNNTLIIKNLDRGDEWVYDVNDMSAPPIFHANAPEWSEQLERYIVDVNRDTSTVTVRDPRTNRIQLQISYLDGEEIYHHTLSSNGRYISIGTTVDLHMSSVAIQNDSGLRNIAVWDTLTGNQVAHFEVYSPMLQTEFSPDNKYLAWYSRSVMGYGIAFGLYDIINKQQLIIIENRYDTPSSLSFSPDSRLLAVTHFDGRIVMIETKTGAIHADIHGYRGIIEHIHFDENNIITSLGDWWDLDTFVHQQRDSCNVSAIHPTESIVACGQIEARFETQYQPTRILNLQTGQETEVPFSSVWFHPDGQTLIAIDDNDNFLIWDVSKQTTLATIANGFRYRFVRDITFLKGGRYFASRSHGTIWDTDTYKVAFEFPASADINSIGAYSESGDWVALPNTDDDSILIWRLSDILDRNSPAPIRILTGYDHAVISANPNGSLMIVTTNTGSQIYETSTFTVAQHYNEAGLEVVFSPDGRFIIHAEGECLACGERASISPAQVWAVPKAD